MGQNQDAAFAEAMAEATMTEETTTQDVVDEQPESEAPAEDDQQQQQDEPFPKKAVNSLKRKDKQLRALRQEKRELSRRIAEYEAKQKESTPDPEPTEDDFESYGDYLKARQDWQFSSRNREQDHTRQTEDFGRQEQELLSRRDATIAEMREQFFKDVPDARKVMQDNAALLRQLPTEIGEIVLELDNPTAAVYTLIKEGRIEDVAYMTPHLAAAELVAAQQRGQTLNSVPTTTGDTETVVPPEPMTDSQALDKAPRPMAPAKGGGKAQGKSLINMDARALYNWAKGD